jgi:hypothetical protein
MPEEKLAVRKEKDVTPMDLLQQAMGSNLTPEVMKGYMDLYNEWDAKKAKKEFNIAMASFQGECPVIVKEKGVKNKDGTPRYKYAPLDAIVKQVGPKIAKHGLSYTVNAEIKLGDPDRPACIVATVVITHEGGHSQSSTFLAPIDNDAFMTGPQKFGAALTYAKRYAFCNGFGILTGDVDNDASPLPGIGEKKGVSPEIYTKALGMISQAKTLAEVEGFESKISSSKIYGDDQREQLLRMCDAKKATLK